MAIETIGLEEMQAILQKVQDRSYIKRGFARTGARMQKQLAAYPAQQKGRKQPFTTAKQRRYFFWALKEGIIKVPYRRTGLLGRRWQFKVEQTVLKTRLSVGNNAPYARIVQGDDSDQSHFHKPVWQNTADKVLEENAPLVIADILAAFNADVNL